jgi:Uma2 family endonuclease
MAIEMVGASRQHGLIKISLVTWLNLHIMETEVAAELHAEALKIHIPSTGHYRYPDIAIIKGEPELQDKEADTLLNPTTLMEILSPSTAESDRREKFEEYKSIPTFNEYMLIAQDQMNIERFTRDQDGTWSEAEVFTDPDSELVVASIDAKVSLNRIYSKVKFDA